jgi:hypothetical protein
MAAEQLTEEQQAQALLKELATRTIYSWGALEAMLELARRVVAIRQPELQLQAACQLLERWKDSRLTPDQIRELDALTTEFLKTAKVETYG